MERDITEQLLRWKAKKNRKPLLLTGVRQCGKTYILNRFGENEFEDYAYFNFEKSTALGELFSYDLDVNRIIQDLGTAVLGRKIVPGKTLVVFDEIQACPQAITSLKYFCEEMPELHLIAAGSLLGIALRHKHISFPVGKVERIQMYPMSFTEFVEADGGETLLEGLKQFPLDREIPELYRIPLMRHLKNYYIIGGMPEVVQAWTENHDYAEAEKLQDQILQDYPDDFGKYASNEIAVRTHLVWNSIPVQIAKENNKFVFSHVKTGARAKDLEDSVQWLVDAGLVYLLKMVSEPQIPLSAMADETYFKVYMADVGLLRRKANVNYRAILSGDTQYIQFKGALTENYVMTQLVTMGVDPFFWRSSSSAVVDFVTDYAGILAPIEVKSADNVKAKSLHSFCRRYSPKIAFTCSLKNVGDNYDGDTHIYSVPLYELFRLKEYTDAQLQPHPTR